LKEINLWLKIVILFLVDQGIKLWIYLLHLDKVRPLIPPILYFKPTFNRDYSWVNSLLDLGISRQIHILLTLFLMLLILTFYSYLTTRIESSQLLRLIFIFLFTGALCSLVDRVFWNGSLDYILLKGFFTFDLKDLYVAVFLGTILYATVTKNQLFKDLDHPDLFKDYLKYLVRK